MKTTTFAILALIASSHTAFAVTPNIDVICKPAQELKEPFRVGWNSLVSVKSFSFHMTIANPNGTGKLVGTARDDFKNAIVDLDQDFDVDLRGGQVLDLKSRSSVFGLDFDKVLFAINDIDAPPSAGPLAPGSFPATASLVLVSRYRSSSNADGRAQLGTLNLALNCVYENMLDLAKP